MHFLARFRRRLGPYGFVAPALVVLCGVLLFPLAFSFYMSLFRFSIPRPILWRTYVGLDNYVLALQDAPFLRAIKNTLIITFSSLGIEMIIGTGIAVMLHSKIKFESLYRTILFFPVILSYVVVAVLWRIMMVAEIGLVPYLTGGFAPLSNGLSALLVVILANVWRNIPFVFTVVLAGLKTLPVEPLEAAEIDGAQGLKKFFYIVVPIMKPIFVVVLIMRTMDCLMMFDLVYILTNGGPRGATSTVSTFAVETAFQYFDTGYASALSFIIFFIILIFTVLYTKVFKTNVFAK